MLKGVPLGARKVRWGLKNVAQEPPSRGYDLKGRARSAGHLTLTV